jgi:hypothetical protein
MLTTRRFLASLSVAAAALAGCGSEDPARFGRPPVVESYSPRDRALTAFVGDTLTFSLHAVDPDRDALAMSFAVDGGLRGGKVPWSYFVEDTGFVTVRGTVSDGEFESYIEWRVESFEPVNYPPVISTFQPIEPNPTLIIGSTMAFAVVASDPERVPLTYTFSVNDSLVAASRQFEYLASSTGRKQVLAVVSDGEYTASHEWNLLVTAVPDTITPAGVVITGSGTGVEPGEVFVEWIAVGKDGMDGLPSEYQVRTTGDAAASARAFPRPRPRARR